MRELQVSGVNYRAGTLDAIKQFHIARRLPGLLVGNIVSRDGSMTDEDVVFFYTLAFKGMSDADVEYLSTTCLGACQRQQGAGWAAVQASGGGLMFQDMGMDAIVLLIDAVVQDNLARFFPVPPAQATEGSLPA